MSSHGKGVALMLIAALCFSLMDVSTRLAGNVPVFEKALVRNVVITVITAVWLFRTKEKFRFDKKNLGWLVLRSAAGIIGVVGNMYAISHMLLADASMLSRLTPLFTVVFSAIFLRERMTPVKALLVAAGFLGSLFVIKPTSLSISIPALVGVLAAAGAGGAYAVVRKLGTRGERNIFVIFFFSAFSVVALLPFVLADFIPLTLAQFAPLVMTGVFAMLGQYAITMAFTHAPARDISIFDYMEIIYVALISFALFGEIPDGWSLCGYLTVTGAAVAMYLYDKKKSSRIPEAAGWEGINDNTK